MYKDLTYGRDKKIKNQASQYQPDGAERARISQILKHYQHGSILQTQTYHEFNDRTLIQEMDVNQKAFNSWVPPLSDDPNDSWRAQTVRPVTRNKIIAIAAHVTARIIYPYISAQDEKNKEDKAVAAVMRDLVEWCIENSQYERSFMQAVISMLVDPAAFIEVNFAEVFRKIKELSDEKDENGKYTYTTKEVLDEVLSGFQISPIPCNHILISNIYEPNIQKQRFIIKNRYIDYEEAEQIYGMHPNFKYVRQGVVSVFDEVTNTFYDVKDLESKAYLVKETIYMNRTQDLEIPLINGIMMCDPDRPIQRQDKLYKYAKSGYEPLNNGMFFYYKSCANKLGSDQTIVDTLYNLVIDGSFMQLMPPMAIYGGEDQNSAVMIPGATSSFSDPNTKIESLAPKVDLRGGMEALGMVERSMSESSQDNIRGGIAQGGERTAREIILLDKNAKIAAGLFIKMIGFLVEDLGKLLVGDILQHMTVAQIDEISGQTSYKAFSLPNRISDGRKVTKRIVFDENLLGKEMSEEEKLAESYKLLDEEGGIDADTKIARVNPEMFRNYKYIIRIDPDELTPKNAEIEKAMKMEAFDRLIPLAGLVDQKAITKDFLLDVIAPGVGEKYLVKDDIQKQQQAQDMAAQLNSQPDNKTSVLSQITGSNSLGVAASNPE